MERRLRTYWVLRARFRRVANIATVVGALVGAGLVVAATVQAPGSLGAPDLVAAVSVVLVAALVPRLIVLGFWRLQRGRSRERLG